MKKIDGERAKLYLEFMYGECRHCPDSLAFAANEAAYEFNHDNAMDLFKLLVDNTPIPSMFTHSYGFHTATGRNIIETMKEFYYENEKS